MKRPRAQGPVHRSDADWGSTHSQDNLVLSVLVNFANVCLRARRILYGNGFMCSSFSTLELTGVYEEVFYERKMPDGHVPRLEIYDDPAIILARAGPQFMAAGQFRDHQ
jgi:hypothetical protein